MSQAIQPQQYSQEEGQRDNYIPLPRPRILLLEDNPNVRRSLTEFLKLNSYVVDPVETTKEAGQHLEQYNYQVIFVDIDLLPYDTPGDEFIAENRDLMDGASVFVITGQDVLQKIGQEREQKLLQLDVRILIKGSPVFQRDILDGIDQKMSEIREALIMQRDRLFGLKKLQDDTLPPELYLLASLRQELLEWLRSRSEVDKKGVYYGGKLYSMGELAKEVEGNTAIGQAHLKMMVSLFKRVMR